ncbi:hypothetical protein ACHHYP_09008 [Achlya hypogyna]|uniref:Uncharacterized protein n=1 Tax=Achlya hypogyna TaxID=1202772 RepID=A0A1V9ZJK9_ACHHY|nr:hypothetical protein ACHHYP_09008 [Achlya hypogyna]
METRVSRVNQTLLAIKDVDVEDPDAVEVLNLHGNCIRSLDGLQRFPNLHELSLSSNWIEALSFSALRGLVHLVVLDLSANRLTTTLGFPVLPALKELSIAFNSLQALEGLLDPMKLPQLEILDLRDNDIASIDDLAPLFYLQNLRSLRLQQSSRNQSNPVCATSDYPVALLDKMSALDMLDDEDVDVLREIAALAMPRYNRMAKAVLRRDLHEPSADVQALESRLRRLEEQGQPPTPDRPPKKPAVLASIDSQIRDARHSLRELHHRTLRARSPSISVFVETERRHGYTVHDALHQIAADDSNDDDNVASQPATPTIKGPPQPLTMEDVGSQSDVVETAMAGVQTDLRDDELERVGREYTAMHDRALAAETLVVQLTAADATATAELAQLKLEIDTAVRAQAAGDRLHQDVVARMDKDHSQAQTALQAELGDIKRALLVSQETSRSTAARLEQSTLDFSKLTVVRFRVGAALNEAKAATEAAAKDHASALEAKNHAHTMVAQQLRRELQDARASLEDVYAKYSAKEKEVQQLRVDNLAKSTELDDASFRHKEEWQRREAEWKRHEQLRLRQAAMAVHEMELEFRSKQHEALHKIKALQQALQKSLAETKAWELKHNTAVSRVSDTTASRSALASQKLQAMDKRVHKMQTAFERQMTELQEALDDAETRLQEETRQREAAEDAAREASDRCKVATNALAAVEAQLREAQALVQVKNVMLDDQSRLLLDARKEKDDLAAVLDEARHRLVETEAALDDSLAAQAEMTEYQQELEWRAEAVEKDAARLVALDQLQDELQAKVAALEYLEGELHRMRKTIAKQEARSADKHAQLEAAHAAQLAAGDQLLETAKQRILELEDKLKAADAQLSSANRQQHALQKRLYACQTQVQTTENEMKVLLVQMERERAAKRQHAAEMGRLVQKLNKDAP